MPSYNLRIFLCLAPSFLVLAFSGLIIVLERITQSLFRSHTTRDFRDGSAGITYPGIDLTVNEDHGPTWALLGVGVLGVLFACMSAAGMWELRRVNGVRGAGQRAWCWGVLCMNAVMLGVSVGVLAWASSLQAAQSGVNLKEDNAYSRETWLCRIDALYADQEWAASACGTAKATRFMLIPVAIGSLLAIVAVWFAAKPRGGTSWLVGGKGRYGGFQSVYEMGPQGPPPQYQHPPPQFYPIPQAYSEQQNGAPQFGYAMPPQGFQPGHPPGPYAPAPQMHKGGAVATDPAVFR